MASIVLPRLEKYIRSGSLLKNSKNSPSVILNRHWGGLPIYIRAGKKMALTATEVLVEFKRPPRFPKQGHYANDPMIPENPPDADIHITCIGDLLSFNLPDFLKNK